MSYFAFLSEHGPTLLLGTVTTIKVLICATILYVKSKNNIKGDKLKL